MRVEKQLRERAKAKAGVVELEIAPMEKEPEPRVPADLKQALAAAGPTAQETWKSIDG